MQGSKRARALEAELGATQELRLTTEEREAARHQAEVRELAAFKSSLEGNLKVAEEAQKELAGWLDEADANEKALCARPRRARRPGRRRCASSCTRRGGSTRR